MRDPKYEWLQLVRIGQPRQRSEDRHEDLLQQLVTQRAVTPEVLEFARRLHHAGVPMIIGTDGAGGDPFYAHELALHVEAGIPAWEVLRMSTSSAADTMDIGHRTGRIAVGHEADMVFLTADPVTDVLNAAKVYGVLDNGRIFTTAQLLDDP